MKTIEKIYTNYDGLLEEFSEEVIQSRYAVFYEEIEEFAKWLPSVRWSCCGASAC